MISFGLIGLPNLSFKINEIEGFSTSAFIFGNNVVLISVFSLLGIPPLFTNKTSNILESVLSEFHNMIVLNILSSAVLYFDV